MSNFDRWRPGIASLLLAAALIGLAGGCSVIRHGPEAGPPPPVAPDSPPPPLPVDKAPEDVIVAAWAEACRFPESRYACGRPPAPCIRAARSWSPTLPGAPVTA